MPFTAASTLLLLACMHAPVVLAGKSDAMQSKRRQPLLEHALAVADATFPCQSGVHDVPWAHYNDSVCDCCDGSDEPNGACVGADANAAAAPDDIGGDIVASAGSRCDDMLTERRAPFLSAISVHKRGSERLRKHYSRASPEARAWLKQFYDDADALVQKFDALNRRFETQRSVVQKKVSSNTVTAAEIMAMERQRLELMRAQDAAAAAQLRGAAEFGAGDRFAQLGADGCFDSPPLSEKVTKGGSTTPLPKTYVYTLCWGSNVTQREWEPGAWARAAARAHGLPPPPRQPAQHGDVDDSDEDAAADVGDGGGTTARLDVAPDGAQRAVQRPARLGAPVTLGVFRGFLSITQAAVHMDAGYPHYARVAPARAPTADALAAMLSSAPPDAEHLARAVSYYEAVDTCVSGDVRAPRRVYVFHVCANMDARSWNAAESAQCRTRRPAALWEGRNVSTCAPLPPRVLPAALQWNAADNAALRAAAGAPLTARQLAAAGQSRAHVLHVEEDGLCTYKVFVATDFACDTYAHVDLRAALRELPTPRATSAAAQSQSQLPSAVGN